MDKEEPIEQKIYGFRDDPDLAEALRRVGFAEGLKTDSELIRKVINNYPPIAAELRKIKREKKNSAAA